MLIKFIGELSLKAFLFYSPCIRICNYFVHKYNGPVWFLTIFASMKPKSNRFNISAKLKLEPDQYLAKKKKNLFLVWFFRFYQFLFYFISLAGFNSGGDENHEISRYRLSGSQIFPTWLLTDPSSRDNPFQKASNRWSQSPPFLSLKSNGNRPQSAYFSLTGPNSKPNHYINAETGSSTSTRLYSFSLLDTLPPASLPSLSRNLNNCHWDQQWPAEAKP